MQIFKNFPGEHDPGPPYSLSCFSISFKLILSKKILLKNAEIMPPLFLISRCATALVLKVPFEKAAPPYLYDVPAPCMCHIVVRSVLHYLAWDSSSLQGKIRTTMN